MLLEKQEVKLDEDGGPGLDESTNPGLDGHKQIGKGPDYLYSYVLYLLDGRYADHYIHVAFDE